LIEFVNGKTLDQVPPMPMNKLMPVAAMVAAGMVHMHRRGVFHADLADQHHARQARRVKIIDYGLAGSRAKRKTASGDARVHMPETAKSKIVNEKTEIYNFGGTLYRLVTSSCRRRLPHQPKVCAWAKRPGRRYSSRCSS
jgi:tRNA A-37 threonylcarbamoyl transferase component Bud32